METINTREIKPSLNTIKNITELGFYRTLGLEFKPMIPYQKYQSIKGWEKLLNLEMEISFTGYEAKLLNEIYKELQKYECVDFVKHRNGNVITTIGGLMKFGILKQCYGNKIGSRLTQKEVGDLLRGDVKEVYYANDELGYRGIEFLKLIHGTDISEYNFWSAYIKYNNAEGKRRLEEPNKWVYDTLGGPTYNGGHLKTIKYKEEIERNGMFGYISFCIVNLQQKLYLIYGDTVKPNYVGIVDKSHLKKYLQEGVLVIDISSIILDIYCNAFKGTEIVEKISMMKKTEQEWEKFFHDVREDAGNKKKISINAEIQHGIPIFMSAKLKENDMSKYKELEDWIGEDGHIGKDKGRGKYNSITAKKQHVYGSKDDIKALKKMKKK